MGKKACIGFVSLLVILGLTLSSCGGNTTTPTTTSQTTQSTVTTPTTTTTTSVPPTSQTTQTTTVNPSGNWWDALGEPQYGGTINIRTASLGVLWDLQMSIKETNMNFCWEKLWENDWTVDRKIFGFQTQFVPMEYLQGQLAESWEFQDPTTLTIHIRKGVHWQDKAPANGREFTAEDVQYHYDRMLGTGSGFTTPNKAYTSSYGFLVSVTATDKYTCVAKFKAPSALNLFNLASTVSGVYIENREAVEKGGGTIADWQDVVGTSPWILEDFVPGSAITYVRNPNYWGFDERYPKNRLPYADSVKLINMPDSSTAMAAMRTGKLEIMPELSLEQTNILLQSNPELLKSSIPLTGKNIELRNDVKPFNDIRVRKALQMAIDLKTIAKQYYGGSVDGTPTGIVSPLLEGYCYPYSEWPQSLKDEYAYNPAEAKNLLAESGFPEGFKTDVFVGISADEDLLEIIHSYWAAIGVDLEIKRMEYVSFLAAVRTSQHDQMAYTAVGGSASGGPPTITIRKCWSGGWAASNFSHVTDPEYDANYDAFMAETDPAKIPGYLKAADKMVIENHYFINTFGLSSFNVYQPWFKGYSGDWILNSWGHAAFWARFWVDQSLKASSKK